MADTQQSSLVEIPVTDTTPIVAFNTSGIWSKITGLGIKTFVKSWITKSDVGLSNVDNTSDVNKPISTATQTALDAKANTATTLAGYGITNAYTKTETDVYNPDFYQYSIVRTVASGNLTVALKNYEGNDPTPTKPVKIMIGGVVRTITSALSFTMNAGTNWMNLGSSELATKESDLFTYIGYAITSSSCFIGGARIPSGTVWGDFINTPSNEKYISVTSGPIYGVTDPVVNIGRFNATLSAGAGYTWSIPATSVIINRPIYETRWLDYVPSWVSSGTYPTIGNGVLTGRYQIRGSKIACDMYLGFGGTTNYGTGLWAFTGPFIESIGDNTTAIVIGQTITWSGVARALSASKNFIFEPSKTIIFVQNDVLSGTYPFTWGSGNYMNATFEYYI